MLICPRIQSEMLGGNPRGVHQGKYKHSEIMSIQPGGVWSIWSTHILYSCNKARRMHSGHTTTLIEHITHSKWISYINIGDIIAW